MLGKSRTLTKKEWLFLEELQRRKVPFMIVGLMAASLQGAPVVTQDVDLWFEDLSDMRIRESLKKVGGFYIPPFGFNPPLLGGEDFELFDLVTHMHGLQPFQEEYQKTIRIKLGAIKVRVLPLERIIASKEFINRPKDQAVLPALKSALAVLRDKKRKKS